MWRSRFVQKMKFVRDNGVSITSGTVTTGDHFRMWFKSTERVSTFSFCTLDKVPFSAIVGMGMIAKDQVTGAMVGPERKDLTEGGAKNLDWHQHFNPVATYGKDFKRLNSVEFLTIKKVITISDEG